MLTLAVRRPVWRRIVHRNLPIPVLTAALLAGPALTCAAQTGGGVPELVTDRPDFTESSEVVGPRVVQIESGFTLEQDDASTRQMTAPQMLVRVGIGRRAELRFAGDGFVSQSLSTAAGHVRTSGRS